ncbi:MAG: cysteine-rich CWC family protein [Pyrinomonadaceae bacterium]
MNEKTEQIYEPKTCESCGETFGCGAKLDGCWCAELTISPEAADEIKAKFDDCLCPKCLSAIAETAKSA